jgi:GT2 family glycosyltransferase
MRQHKDRDVVILNADTEVYGNWLDRLVAHADEFPRVATVTPLSNNATICSYPETLNDNRNALEISPRRPTRSPRRPTRSRTSRRPPASASACSCAAPRCARSAGSTTAASAAATARRTISASA